MRLLDRLYYQHQQGKQLVTHCQTSRLNVRLNATDIDESTRKFLGENFLNFFREPPYLFGGLRWMGINLASSVGCWDFMAFLSRESIHSQAHHQCCTLCYQVRRGKPFDGFPALWRTGLEPFVTFPGRKFDSVHRTKKGAQPKIKNDDGAPASIFLLCNCLLDLF